MPRPARVRLDQLLVSRGLVASRADAQARILAGQVELGGAPSRALKPGQQVPDDAAVSIVAGPRWASRGGDKLEAALAAFAVEAAGSAALDAGASTGGFTDVLLAHGARIVYAVDVGRGQLHDRLARDARVVSMERTNLRTLERLPEPIDLATLDLSFISLALVLPAVARLLAPVGRVIALVKPQFEAGRDDVPRGGVVRDPSVWRSVLLRLETDASAARLRPTALMRSPIVGGEGNVEFLALLEPVARAGRAAVDWPALVDEVLAAT